MKIAIVTLYHKIFNFGAQLQVYALQKKLDQLGYEAEVLDYKWSKNSVIRTYERMPSAKKFKEFSSCIPHSQEYLPETIRECVNSYDAFVCGSDQTWSDKVGSLRYTLPQLALSFVPLNKIKISYAASMGGTRASSSVEKLIKPYIQELDAISVREISAVPYIMEVAQKPVVNVLDPTLLLTVEDWDKILAPPSEGKYVLYYGLTLDLTYMQQIARNIAEFFGLPLRSVLSPGETDEGPREWIGLVKNAEFVVANSFHAICFSILYKKQFIAAGAVVGDESPYSRNVRTTDLLETFGLMSRYIDPVGFNFKTYIEKNVAIDYTKANKILDEMRASSIKFIKDSLSIKKTGVNDPEVEDSPINKILNSISDPFRDYLRCVDPADFEVEYESIKKEFEKEKNDTGVHVAETRQKMNAQLASIAPDFELGKKYPHVVIYGAGEVGRAASSHFGNRLLCFVDRADELTICCGYPIYRLNDNKLQDSLRDKQAVFIVTPVWDFTEIEKNILALFPGCSVVSMETILNGLGTTKPEPRYTDEVNAQIVLALLKAHGVKKIVVSPGTTNIPIAWGVQYDPFFEVFSVLDERSAAYFACGLAEQSGEKVALSCTEATASRNYMSGLTEAFYRKLPVVAITSTTTTVHYGNLIPQNIDRSSPPNDICKTSVTLQNIKNKNDFYTVSYLTNKAILESERGGGGPVHLNLETTHLGTFNTPVLPDVTVIKRYTEFNKLPELPPERIAFFIGAKRFTDEETEALSEFCKLSGAVVLCDHSSGYCGMNRVDASLIGHNFSRQNPTPPGFVPRTLIHIGEVSAAYPIFGICRIAEKVWRVSEDGEVRDQFKNLTAVFEMPLTLFIENYKKQFSTDSGLSLQFYDIYVKLDKVLRSSMHELPFSNIWIAEHTAKLIPENCKIHLGILNSIRAWNLFPMKARFRSINTGGFGIDGVLSACVGSANADKDLLHICIIGDLAFFYDMNICGNRHVPPYLRIMLINNGEGTEFRNYSHIGAKIGEKASELVAAGGHYKPSADSEGSPACAWVSSLGFKYISAGNKEEYIEALPDFLNENIIKPILFEVFTTPENESAALKIIDGLWALTHSIS